MKTSTEKTMKPRPHQAAALRRIFADLKAGHRQQLVVVPTGGGKTVLAAHVVKRIGGRALFIVHTDELVRQTVKTLQCFVPASAIGIVKGSTDESGKRIVVASVQTLYHPQRLRRLVNDFRVVVWDECHHAQASGYLRIRRHLSNPQTLHLGLTATPWRLDGKALEDLFPRNSVRLTIKDGVLGGWLSGVVGKLVYLKNADFSQLKLERGDFKPSELEIAMRAANWDEYVARAYFEHAGTRKTVVFVPTVAMAHQLAARINAEGGRAEAIDGQMGATYRRDVVARLASGQLDVVINCAVLTEGFDDPLISCVIMARPTASWRLYVQCVGRGLRPVEGKTCLVLDLVGATRRHSLVSFPLFAKREELPNGGRPEAGGSREQDSIGPLDAEQEALWVDLLGDDEANPPCVHCGSGKTRKNKLNKNGNRAYQCSTCNRSFTLTPDGQVSQMSIQQSIPNPPCVHCGSGKTYKSALLKNGNRRYRCVNCNRRFTLTPDGQLARQSLQQSIPNPPCVHCGSGKTRKNKLNKNGNWQYHCGDCKRYFTVRPDSNPPSAKPAPRPVVAKARSRERPVDIG